MSIVAMTGGIGAGKSTVAGILAELGARVFDADEFAREAVAPGSAGLEALEQRFGQGIIGADGSLDRKALASIVFADPDAKRELESIVHPEVQRLAKEAFKAALDADPDAIIVYQIPLLVETGQTGAWDRIVTVEASTETRIQRLMENRGMTADEARARISNQVDAAARTQVADYVINTDGSLDDTKAQTRALWEALTAETSANPKNP